MGKRSAYKRLPKDKYYSFDPRIGAALSPHLPRRCRYWEPCAGAYDLVGNIGSARCVVASDIAPGDERVFRLDALTVTSSDLDETGATHIITNPPWSRQLLHSMIVHFAAMRPTWLLFDADWVHTKQATPYLPNLHKIVSIGRVRWIPGSGMDGVDNCAWYLFEQRPSRTIHFVGRSLELADA